MLAILPRTYAFTVTDELDADYLKYLRRRLRDMPQSAAPAEDALRLDISLDDPEGDVVAGVAARTEGDRLVIEMVWVDDSLRGQGIGRQLIRMAEDIARGRGCRTALVDYAPRMEFYQKLGYSVLARLTQFPSGCTFYRMHKTLPNVNDIYPKIAL
jgi:GNAT superfamily N-acetyltransferase